MVPLALGLDVHSVSAQENTEEGLTLSQAVEQCLANGLGQNGSMITGFLGIVCYMNEDGDNCWTFMRSEHATATNDLGMARIITKQVEADVEHLMFCTHDHEED